MPIVGLKMHGKKSANIRRSVSEMGGLASRIPNEKPSWMRNYAKFSVTSPKSRRAGGGRLRQGEILVAELSGDELSANTGLLASKTCPNCGGTMTIRQGAFSTNKNRHSFYWACISNLMGYRCRTITINLEDQDLDVVRVTNPDLDGEASKRRIVWTRQDVIAKTHQRFRAFVGEIDDDLMCPIHVAPMRIQQSPRAGGRVLDSYEYACTAVLAKGIPCDFEIPIASFPQVASVLRRKTTRGIIDGLVQY